MFMGDKNHKIKGTIADFLIWEVYYYRVWEKGFESTCDHPNPGNLKYPQY